MIKYTKFSKYWVFNFFSLVLINVLINFGSIYTQPLEIVLIKIKRIKSYFSFISRDTVFL